MEATVPAIDIQNLEYSYGRGRADAVHGFSLTVEPGRCYGLFGRNGAGKTTAIKCLLNLLRPKAGTVRIFGMDPDAREVETKSRLAYVPDQVGLYPWMTIRETLDYFASFRKHWSAKIENDLLGRFQLDATQRAGSLSKGQRTQVALIAAVCPEPDLLVLDEPTSGLDPIVRREFIETVIGAYQEGNPGNRTILVSTHMIAEFEGLIDQFTIMDRGAAVLTLDSDGARARYRKIRARFNQALPEVDLRLALHIRRTGREMELIVNGGGDELMERLRAASPESLSAESLSLEEVFIASLKKETAV